MKTVLFVCSGNTCRSPMAEAVARNWVEKQRDRGHLAEDVLVASAGTFASDGSMPTREATIALRDAGIDHDGRSKRLTAEMIINATLILCMTEGHRHAVHAILDADGHVDDAETLIELLDPQHDIADPIGMPQEIYDDVLHTFMELIPERLAEYLGITTEAARDS